MITLLSFLDCGPLLLFIGLKVLFLLKKERSTLTIRNPELFVAGLWDWQCLDDCLPGKMKVSDIDGAIERNGQFLFIETKGPNVPIPMGQEIFYKNLHKKKDFTILYVWGTPGQVEELEMFYPDGKMRTRKKPADLEDLKRIIRWWFGMADSKKKGAQM